MSERRLAPSDFLAPGKVAAAMRTSSQEQDRRDAEMGWPEIETFSRHRVEECANDPAYEDIEDDCDALEIILASDWEGKPVPERQWIVRDWIPMHGVTLVAGKGGTGKSLAVQQWLSAIAVGAEFMGLRSPAPLSSLYLNCEDTADELHRRQADIARTMGRSLAGFGSSLKLAPRIGKENALGTVDEKGRFMPSQLFHAIKAQCLALGIRVLALDNAMQHYVGNPNDNGEVTRFLNALTALALDIDGAVILVAHTAKADGSEFMGCMAWENGVRSRLYLARETDEDEAGNTRILSRNKSNMAAIGERLEMEWHAGAFRPLDRTSDESADARHEAAFLRCLDEATEQRVHVSHSAASPSNFAPKVFASMVGAKGSKRSDLERAMRRLFDKGQIVANSYLWNDEKARPKSGLKRVENVPNLAPNPVPHTFPNPPEPLDPNLPPHTPYTTYNGAGPAGPPPLDEDEAWLAEQRAYEASRFGDEEPEDGDSSMRWGVGDISNAPLERSDSQ